MTGGTVACAYKDFPDYFGFFLPLAGISTVRQITENAFDIRATSRLNRLYVALLKDNPEWGKSERRHDMNHFMARLIFCFFAEDTDIFNKTGLFTSTVEQMTERDSSNTHEVIGTLFRAMNARPADRAAAKIPRWADAFPYVNGGLFSGDMDVPRFSKIARSYLLHIGSLDWKKINPDIFGSMIQAVAEDEERGALGMHYTSVPNILKVLNPLFLYDLRAKLAEAGDNTRKLLNLRDRIKRIRVFDPACGSGRFELDLDGFGAFQPIRCICDGRYKLAINLLDTDELYDLQTDPTEMSNLIESSEHGSIRNNLHDRLLNWMNTTRDPFRGYYWGRRAWRADYRETWAGDAMVRNRRSDGYLPGELDYETGLPFTQATREKPGSDGEFNPHGQYR